MQWLCFQPLSDHRCAVILNRLCPTRGSRDFGYSLRGRATVAESVAHAMPRTAKHPLGRGVNPMALTLVLAKAHSKRGQRGSRWNLEHHVAQGEIRRFAQGRLLIA